MIIGGIAGGIVGFLIAKLRSRESETKNQLEKLQSEMDEYKANVRSHFIDTVSLLSQIDQRQKQLHQAVAQGVVDLCKSEGDDDDYLLEQSVLSLRQLDDSDDRHHNE